MIDNKGQNSTEIRGKSIINRTYVAKVLENCNLIFLLQIFFQLLFQKHLLVKNIFYVSQNQL